MDIPRFDFGNEITEYITKELIIYTLNKYSYSEVLHGIMTYLYFNDDYPENNTVKHLEENRGKIFNVSKILISKDEGWIEEDITTVTLKMQKKTLDIIMAGIIPKPDNLKMEKFQEFLLNYQKFYDYIKKEGIIS
jgi:hypothetical protein